MCLAFWRPCSDLASLSASRELSALIVQWFVDRVLLLPHQLNASELGLLAAVCVWGGLSSGNRPVAAMTTEFS